MVLEAGNPFGAKAWRHAQSTVIFFVGSEQRLQPVCVHTDTVCPRVAGLASDDDAQASGTNLREHLKDSVIKMNEILFKGLKLPS